MHYSRSHDAVIRVYDDGGNMIETHENTRFQLATSTRDRCLHAFESLNAHPCVYRVLPGKLDLQLVTRDLHDSRFDLLVFVRRDQLVSFNAPLAFERNEADDRC